MIQNHSPSNLNRDDLGAPKTCIFGGVTRARISSQCLKRSIRRSQLFQAALEKGFGVRTRRLITILAEQVHPDGDPPRELVDFVAEAFKEGGVKRVDARRNPQEPDNTNILLFVPQSAIDEMAQCTKEEWESSDRDEARLAERLAEALGKAASVPDIALCGRMTELEPGGLFAKLDLHVDAALAVAHAMSTHETLNEVDYFTAVDDRAKGTGAGHVDEAQYNSACYYKYFSVDWEQLVRNLAGAEPKDPGKGAKKAKREAYKSARRAYEKRVRDAQGVAAATLGHFLIAAARTTPSGKQKSFAAYNEPTGILVEFKSQKTPTSYANAFAEPARRIGLPDDDAPDVSSLEGRSIAQLGDHVLSLRKTYQSKSELLWYSPKLWRFPLRGWEREADGKKKEPRPFATATFSVLVGAEGGAEAKTLVEAVIEKLSIGRTWAELKGHGNRSPQES